MKLVEARTRDQLVREWDDLAIHRERLISNGKDLSYRHVLLPSLRDLSVKQLVPGTRVLDVGCGTGTFVSELAAENPKIEFIGIDPSVASISIATNQRRVLDNCAFNSISVEDFAAQNVLHSAQKFDLVIANMLLQNVESLPNAMSACANVLVDGGAFVFAIPHPCFWPRYWRYDEEPWFRYDAETWIEAPFKTSLAQEWKLRTSHTHRPLGAYIDAFARVGLSINAIQEPMPDAGIEGAYPIAWEFPRFLLGRCFRSA